MLLLFIVLGYETLETSNTRVEVKPITLEPKSIVSVYPNKEIKSEYSVKKTFVQNNRIDQDLSSLAAKNANLSSNNISDSLYSQSKYPFETDLERRNISFLRVLFDNDIFNNTDYYYTNGLRVELVADFIKSAPTSKILPALNNSDFNYQGFSVIQTIYTPINPESEEIVYDDRPFSSYLTIGHFRKSISIEKGLRMSSEFAIGVLGPAALGGRVQASLHEKDPIGWVYQIENDIVLDYSFSIDKAILRKKHIEAFATASARVGTLYDNLSGGLSIRFGWFLPILDNQVYELLQLESDKFKFWFFMKANVKAVVYDATLKGGMFNSSSLHTIDADKINRFVIDASAGLAIYHKNFGLEYENFYLSPEFEGAKNFGYGRIKVVLGF